MPGTRCTVAICNNSLVKTKKLPRKISYHSFPVNEQIRKQWIKRCRRDGEWNANACHVCSEHFLEEDYIRDLKAELLNLPRKTILKPTAVPSKNLLKPKICNRLSSTTNIIYKKRKRPNICDTLPAKQEELTIVENFEHLAECEITELKIKNEELVKKNEELLKKNETLQLQLTKLRSTKIKCV